MSIIKSIKKIFSGEKETIEINYTEASDFFKDRKKEQITSTENRVDSYISNTRDILEEMEEELEKLREYSDKEDVKVIENVVESFYRSQKRLIDRFNPSSDIKKHRDELEKFIDNFNDVSNTEVQVMKRVENNSDFQFMSMEKLINHFEEIENFIKNDYIIIERFDKIKKLENEVNSLHNDIKKIESNIDIVDIDEFISEIDKIEEEIEEIRNSDEWRKKKELKSALEEKKRKNKKVRNDISSSISKMDRGIRKIVYKAENGEINFQQDIDDLRKLQSNEYTEIKDINSLLDETLEKIEKEDILGDRQLENFRKAKEKITSPNSILEKPEKLNKKTEELKQKLDKFDINKKLEKLEKEKNQIRDKIKNKKKKYRKQKQELKNKKNSLKEKLKKLEEQLNKSVNTKIKLK